MNCAEGARRTVVEEDDAGGAGEVFEELLALGVVLRPDLRVGEEGLVRGRPAEVLEPVGVERDGVLVAAEVRDVYVVQLALEVVRALSGCIGVDELPRLLAVRGRDEVGEGCGSRHGWREGADLNVERRSYKAMVGAIQR